MAVTVIDNDEVFMPTCNPVRGRQRFCLLVEAVSPETPTPEPVVPGVEPPRPRVDRGGLTPERVFVEGLGHVLQPLLCVRLEGGFRTRSQQLLRGWKAKESKGWKAKGERDQSSRGHRASGGFSKVSVEPYPTTLCPEGSQPQGEFYNK
jgi:hypothetical protein